MTDYVLNAKKHRSVYKTETIPTDQNLTAAKGDFRVREDTIKIETICPEDRDASFFIFSL